MGKRGNIYFLSYYFPPSNAVGGHRIMKFAGRLCRAWHCRIYSSSHYYEGRYDAHLKQRISSEDYEVIRLSPWWDRLFTSLTYGQPLGVVSRILRRGLRIFMWPDKAVLWTWAAYRALVQDLQQNRQNPNIIWVSMSPYSSGVAGVWAKKKTGAKLVLDFRDPWTLNPMNRKGRIRRGLETKLEKWMLDWADRILVTSPASRQLFQNHYPSVRDIIEVVPNGYTKEDVDRPSCDEYPASAGVAITYTGSFYGDRQPYTFLKAFGQWMQSAQSPMQVKIVFAGGNDYAQISAFAERIGVRSYIEFYGEIRYSESLKKMHKSDILLLLNGESSTNDIFIPAKLFDYMKTGKPILFIGGGDTANIIANAGLGEVSSHQVDEIEACLTKMLRTEFLNHFVPGNTEDYEIRSICAAIETTLTDML